MYRKSDISFLQDIYDRPSNDIVLLYGPADRDIAGIVSDLIHDKESVYYKACAVDDNTQKNLFALSLHDQARTPVIPEDDYEKLIISYIGSHSDRKKIIVLDGFLYLIKENPTFINFLASLLSDKCESGTAMFLLVCDDVRWVENDMLRIIGKKSSEISAVIKLNEYTPSEFAACFPGMPLNEQIRIYSFIGGRSLYYNDISDKTTLRELIIKQLNTWMGTDHNRNIFLPDQIREAVIYNTILVGIAGGKDRLGELAEETHITRAKLSVYLKKLTEYGLVDRGEDTYGNAASESRKGIYRISDGFVRLYYRFVYPRASTLYITGADRFYRRYIEPGINDFIEEAYPLFCMEHIKWLQREGRLNFKVASVDEFRDKNRAIDFVITAAGGSVIACSCRYGTQHMPLKTYEDVRASVRKNRLNCDNIWLFSTSGFEQKLFALAGETLGLKLIEGKDQRLR